VSAAAGSLELLRAASRTPVPWKNGGGLTREVAIFPPGSDLQTFEWRISIADIRGAGPFSRFPGVDRQMTVVSGRLSLTVDAAPAVTLTPESDALAFPGEVPVFAEPLGAPVTDLNVMTRRARCTATLTRRLAQPSAELEPGAGTTLLVALAGLVVRRAGAELALDELDGLRIGCGGRCTITARSGASAFYLIEVL
jgi:hypothetical protein